MACAIEIKLKNHILRGIRSGACPRYPWASVPFWERCPWAIVPFWESKGSAEIHPYAVRHTHASLNIPGFRSTRVYGKSSDVDCQPDQTNCCTSPIRWPLSATSAPLVRLRISCFPFCKERGGFIAESITPAPMRASDYKHASHRRKALKMALN